MFPFFFLFLFASGLVAGTQKLDVNDPIIEVYLDAELVSTFDYQVKIVSKGDTLTPNIKDRYYLPPLKLDTFVTFILINKSHTLIISHVENIFLTGHSHINIVLSSFAIDSCITTIFSFADFNSVPSTPVECNNSHNVLFEKLSRAEMDDFYKVWNKKISKKH